MPGFKTHSIHGELIFPYLDKKVDIYKEDLKSFCIGPDAMILTDYNTFNYQHTIKTRRFFCTLINIIKKKKLLDNSEVMAFLYGQLDHFILDSTMHPLIYYMTENIQSDYKLKPHSLVESWIDDYTIQKNNKKELIYYHKWFIKNRELKRIIDEVYSKVYKSKKSGIKYSLGMFSTIMFDMLAKRNMLLITPIVIKVANLGDFTYKNDYNRALPYLNLNNEIWYNPETMEEYRDSFDDLWKKSIEYSLDSINDINGYLYNDKQLTNRFILDDTSWNTGLPCKKGQTLKYVKKY